MSGAGKRLRETGVLQTLALTASLLLSSLVFFWVCMTTSGPDMSFDTEPVYLLSSPWQVTVNGEEQGTVTLPTVVEAQAGDEVVFSTVLETRPTVCNSILFHSSHQYVKVALDGQTLLQYGHGQTAPVRMSPGSPWQFTRLPDGWAGKTLSIHLSGYYNSKGGKLNAVALGTKAGLLYYVVKEALPMMITMLPTLVMGLALLGVSFAYRRQEAARRFRYLGAFTLAACCWVLLEAQILQIFYGNILVAMNLIFILFGLLPILIVCYLLCYPMFQKCWYMKGMLGLSVAINVLMHGLRILDITDYMQSVAWIHGALLLIIAGVIFVFAKEWRSSSTLDGESQLLFLALTVFSLFGLLDIVRFYLPGTHVATKYSSQGLFCFVMILSYSAARQAARTQTERIEQEVFRRLAYTDILTGLKNRTRFEEEMERYRRSGRHSHPIIMMADMNGLKWINDNLGHAAGDQALLCVARLLEKHFGKSALCCRIGGDEFCVLTERFEESRFAETMEAFAAEVAQQTVEGHPLSIACGFARQETQTMDKVLMEADERMYRNKHCRK